MDQQSSDAGQGISVVVNGDSHQVPAGLTVTALLERFDLKPGMVVVELNREILSRDHYGQTPVADGDRIELVHFVGGG